MTTLAEENYLKAILKLSQNTKNLVSTNAIAHELNTKASSVTEMIKKLTDKKFLIYKKYKGVYLSEIGYKNAIDIIRKHRLWEYFLVYKMKFEWDEVHDIAEQLEHIKSQKLINSLDKYLGKPKFDPHGEPIPSQEGLFPKSISTPLSNYPLKSIGQVVGLCEDQSSFLNHLDHLSIAIGSTLRITRKIEFDKSIEIEINNQQVNISHEVAKNILIKDL